MTNFRLLRRGSYIVAVIGLLSAVAFPIVQPRLASADQLVDRSITLSDSGASGGTITSGIGSGTNVTYQVQFTTSEPADSIIIEFCENNPIIRDTCTEPAGMDVSGVALVGTGAVEPAGWTVTGSAVVDATTIVRLVRTTGAAAGIGAHTFQLTGITNPSAPAAATPPAPEPSRSFYARIYTYADSTTYATYASPTAPGTFADYGGIALSTSQVITITARVQEQLSFCVSGSSHANWITTDDCSDTNAVVPPALTLGHGSPTATLDSSQIDEASAYSQISTNASDGFAVALRNSNAGLPTPCGGLSANGVDCGIPAVGGGGFAIGTMNVGTAAFGLRVTDGFAATSGTTNEAQVLADANYEATDIDPSNATGGGAAEYGMDTSDVGTGGDDVGSVIGTFGDVILASTVPVYKVNNTYTFAATAALITPAGIYTANIDLIATGKF